jgi:anti-anti-sigma factor
MLDVEARRDGDVVRLILRGELDLATVPIVSAKIQEACKANPTALVLDFGELAFCDSSGVREVIAAADNCREQDVKFSVVDTRPNVRRIFEISGLADLLNDNT